jgi:hypothetical protein
MPALVDAHVHLGWAILKNGTIGKDTYSKENLADHLRIMAYYGIGAAFNMGIDPGDAAYQIRAEPVPARRFCARLAGEWGCPTPGRARNTGVRWRTA